MIAFLVGLILDGVLFWLLLSLLIEIPPARRWVEAKAHASRRRDGWHPESECGR